MLLVFNTGIIFYFLLPNVNIMQIKASIGLVWNLPTQYWLQGPLYNRKNLQVAKILLFTMSQLPLSSCPLKIAMRRVTSQDLGVSLQFRNISTCFYHKLIYFSSEILKVQTQMYYEVSASNLWRGEIEGLPKLWKLTSTHRKKIHSALKGLLLSQAGGINCSCPWRCQAGLTVLVKHTFPPPLHHHQSRSENRNVLVVCLSDPTNSPFWRGT